MILFIDDEKREMESFVIELGFSGYEVEFKTNVDEAWDFLCANRSQIEVLILDIMMPTGNKFKDDDNHNGLRTGVRFYDDARAKFPDISVIIFTNVADPKVAKKFEKEKKCRYFSKPNLLPHQLADEIKSLLGQ